MKLRNLILLSLLSVHICIFPLSTTDAVAAEPDAFSSWAKTAKLGGAALFTGMTDAEMDQVLSDLVAQKVTVIEADSDLSNYMTDAEFDLELSLMQNFATEAHKRGLRVVWYYPSLEVITVNGKNIDQTMGKEHPDWLQIGLDGTPNVFYGGSGQVFWVEEDDESAWMSPSSPGYREYFFDRVRKIAATGIDGLWVDVPIYADFGPTQWTDFNPDAVARFESDTGLTTPTALDWNDSAWRRWIAWRHEEIARFLNDVKEQARSVHSEFPIFAETLPTDYNGATIYGLDGGYLKDIEGLTHIWEVDTMSNNVGMRNALEDDWISFISAFKYARAASGDKPSWVFTYGKETDDAELVMAEALAAGNNPYELQVPEMTTTVSADYRTRMFGWAQENAPYLFEAQTGADVAIFYSSPSRDYVDKFEGLGMFVTWESNDSLWWAGDAIDSAYERQYLAEFRGMVKLLVHEHVPFDTVVNPADQQELASYDTVILPDVEAISDSEADILRQYVQNGGNLIVTGPDPTGLDNFGAVRSEYALADLLGFSKNDPLPTEAQYTYGAGSVYFYSSLLGKSYFVSSDASAQQTLATAVQATTNLPLTTDADRRVHFELSHLGDQTVLQFVNFIGVDGSFSIVPTSFSVSLEVPAGKQVTGVASTSPDSPNTPALESLAYTAENQHVNFTVPLDQYALVVVSYDGAQPPQNNHMPVAGRDDFTLDPNTSLEFTDAMLLENDGDLDGDTLTVTTIDAENINGSLVDLGGGSYTYTPLQNFSGTETLSYSISDGNGGTDSGFINIIVAPSTITYYPEAVTVTTGTFDWGTMASFTAVDDDTYDINSASVSGGREVDWYATTTILESSDNVSKIKVTHIGQYSQANVSQDLHVYNFQTGQWELIDSSIVGNDDDVAVAGEITSEVANYISTTGELRVRVRGLRSGSMSSWSNALYWEVSQAATGTNTPPVAAFTMTSTELDCVFTDQSTDSDGTLTAWNWDFGDGNNSAEQNPAHTYTAVGTYTVSLTVTDDGGATNTASQSITVNTANQPPMANDQTLATTPDVPLNITLTASDPENDPLSMQITTNPANGTLDGTPPDVTYTPTAGFIGSDGFTFVANDGSQDSNTATVTITVSATNQPPVADDQTLTTAQDVPINITLTASDPESDPITMQITTNPANGTLDGTLPDVTYTPTAGFIGSDGFTFVANDGNQDSNTATVTITVSATNQPPVADDQALTTTQDVPINITLTASDPESDPITMQITTNPANGTLDGTPPDVNYTPNLGFVGSDGFTFVANDGNQDSNTATISITVNAASGSGDISNYTNNITIDGDLADWNGLVSFGTDPDDISNTAHLDWRESWMAHDDNNFYLAIRNDSNISLSWAYNVYLDTDGNSNSGFYDETFPIGAEYLMQGGYLYRYTGNGTSWSWSSIATLSQAVSGTNAEFGIPRGDIGAPSTLRLFYYGDNNAYSSGATLDLYPDDSLDPSGQQRFFTYTITATTNQPPVANGQSLTTDQDVPLNITLTATDPEGDALTMQVVNNPTNGTLSGTLPDLTYTPDSGFVGSDSFTFVANDGTQDSNIATISITVNDTATNQPPVADDQSLATNKDVPLNITLTATDPEGDALTIQVVNNPTSGTLSGTPPDLSYTPDSGFVGSDSFTFVANDGTQDSNIATISITVNDTATNQPPVADDQSLATNKDVPINITLTATDPEGDALTMQVVNNPTNGTLSGTLPDLTYTPDSGFVGSDSFTFVANDGTQDSNIATISITVNDTATNQPPVADDQSLATNKDVPINITLTATDPEGDALTMQVVNNPTNGTLSGTLPDLTYTPDSGFVGSDSFTFVANDGTQDSNTATISITVNDTVGGISNYTNNISIDGDLADWSSLVSFGTDPDDISNTAHLDWREGWLAHDDTNIFLAIRNDSNISLSWAYNVYLDTDGNSSTGFYNDTFPIGAEYLMQGGYLYQYTGNGTSWSWSFIATLPQAVSGTNAEFVIPRADIGSPNTLQLFYYGDNNAYASGATLDIYPDQALNPAGDTRFFEYIVN